MRGKVSENLCEAPMIMRIRGKRRIPPGRFANLWSNKVKSRSCKVESVYETSEGMSISKRRYGIQAEGSPIGNRYGMKNSEIAYERLWLYRV